METTKTNEVKKTKNIGDIYFCPNGQHLEIFTRKNLSPEKRTIIRQLLELDKRRNWIIPFHFLLWIGSGIIAIQTTWIWVDIICMCIGGIGMSGLAVLVHESSHYLFTHKKIDKWIGLMCGLPILLPANTYRLSHMNHHKFVRTRKDPDDLENLSSQGRWLPFLYILMLFFGAYLYVFHVPISAWKTSKKNRFSILLESLSIWVIVIMAWVLLPANVMVQGWLLPLLFAAQILNIRGISEHGLTSTGNEFVDSRTILSNPLVSFLGCNVNYHLAHHLFPGIPWYNLPKLHSLLSEEFLKAGASVYKSYTEFLLDLFRVFRDGIRYGTLLIPKYLREQLCV